MPEDQAPYVTAAAARRFVALGKVAGLWHVVTRTAAGGRRLLALAPRRRRAFSPAELVPAERFATAKEARGVGRECGFARTYATLEPSRGFPAAAAIARRPILDELRPIDGAEAEALAAFAAASPADVAAVASLSKAQLERAVLLLLLRSYEVRASASPAT